MTPNVVELARTPVSYITLADGKRGMQAARESLAASYDLNERTKGYEHLLALLSQVTVRELDRKVKHGEHLTFEEAFCGTCIVLAATNQHFYSRYLPDLERAYGSLSHLQAVAIASAFLNLMATKESLSVLTPEEVAGMAAAGSLDTVFALKLPEVIETCGMGGDRGIKGTDGARRKSINVSTLSSLVLASLGLPAVKHGSYGNTSALGSTDAIEQFGATTALHSEKKMRTALERSGYCFFDAHLCKTIHDLSHLLMMETVNHVIGPMTPPLHGSTVLHKVMGVNEKIHPETVAKAFALLHRSGLRTVGSALIVSGLSVPKSEVGSPEDYDLVRRTAVLDELSPFASIVALTIGGEFLGNYVIDPSDFGISVDPEAILIKNTKDVVFDANVAALTGENKALAEYLAMNAALGLFAYEYLSRPEATSGGKLNTSFLRECFERCLEGIVSGRAHATLKNYSFYSGETW